MPLPPSRWIQTSKALLPAVLALAVFALLFSLHHKYPGLFMDSVNPEYLAARILNHAAAQYNHVSIVPGNFVDDRFPILSGSFYHGPLQLYTSLPIYYALDTTITSARLAQGLYGAAILLLVAGLLRRHAVPVAVALCTLLLLAVDPAFMQSFKTQALSTVWPLGLLLASVLLTERWALEGRVPRIWELIAAGVLAGLAFFSYFIYLFFVPALVLHLFLAWRAIPPHRSFWSAVAFTLFGFLLGCIPYFVGYGLLYSRFDGWAGFYAYLTGAAQQLQVTSQASSGLAAKAANIILSTGSAANDNWLSQMVFREPGKNILGNWKAALLALVSLLGVVFGQRGMGLLRLPAFFLMAWAGFFAMALPLGTRLDGHHFVVLLPCLYMGAAFSAHALLARQYRAIPREFAAVALAVLFAVLAFDAVQTQRAFQQRLVQTHGVGPYSATINELSANALRHPHEMYAFPDWGFFMPFAFLTGGEVSYNVDTQVTKERIMESVCRDKPFNLVRAGDGWTGVPARASLDDKRAQAVALVPGLLPRTYRYNHQDGSPVFEVHRYELSDKRGPGFCGIYAIPKCALTANAAGAEVQATPCILSMCPNTPGRVVNVQWDSGNPRASVEIWVASNVESPRKLWAVGAATGSAATGPWAGPGSVFEVRQADTQQVLASLTLGGQACRTSP